jgi:hypothetical protein
VPGARYCSDLVGFCLGPGGRSVNGKTGFATRAACQAQCNAAAPACVGYAYWASTEYCEVLGPGLDTNLAGGWEAATHPTTTIDSGDARAERSSRCVQKPCSGVVCAAVAGRN